MKIRATIVLFFALVMSGCAQKKNETTENHMDSGQVPSKVAAVKAFQNVDPAVKSQINGFLSDYFALNQSLIDDQLDGARTSAKKLSATIGKFDMSKLQGEQMDFYHAQLAVLNKGLSEIEKSADIAEVRLGLSTITDGIYALVKAFHPNESALYYQFCPMAKDGAGATWISNSKEIANPYMGQSMPHCGMIQETIN